MAEERETRAVAIDTLIELAKHCPEIVVLDADVSKSTQTRRFGQAHPGRFFNVGIAEMNMASMAAGLAASGKTPFIFSFAVFVALRALEPIRTQISYPALNVKVVGGYSGLSAHQHGPTHHCLQDSAIMRTLPNFVVLSPSDWVQTAKAVEWLVANEGPAYLRLGYVKAENLYSSDIPFERGRGYCLRQGNDVTLITTGLLARRTLAAAEHLAASGIAARVIDCPWIKPLDRNLILQAAQETGRVVAIEEHTVLGGLGSAVAELLGQECPVPMRIVGVADHFAESAPYEQLLDHYGLAQRDIENAARVLMQQR